MTDELALLPARLAAHLGLSLLALAAGIIVSVPLGVLVSRRRRLERPLLAAASVAQTIPSLALLAFMVPALAAIGVESIGYVPALIGLSVYSVLPILRNTVTGLASIDPSLLEAARGVGMTSSQSLRRVELPLAMPTIVAGIRISAVWTVGTATLATPVGASGLGDYIFAGLQTRNHRAVLVGCLASAALALLLDGLVRLFEIAGRERRKTLLLAGLAALLALLAIPLAPLVGRAREPTILVGAKTFTEQYVLSQIVAGVITRETGLPTRSLESLGSTVVFDALRSGQIDAYVDYTGTLWATVLHRGDVPNDRTEVREEVSRQLEARWGIVTAAALGFENTYALALRREVAARLGVHTIGQLVQHAPDLSVGGDYELFHRPEWKRIRSGYGLDFARERTMDPSLLYEAVRSGEVDVIGAYSTDGRISSFDLVVLEDDQHRIPPYDAVLLVSARLARTHPEVLRALRTLDGRFDAARMRRMNAAVDEGRASPATVARSFLEPSSDGEGR